MLLVSYSFAVNLLPLCILEVALPNILKRGGVSVSATNATNLPMTNDDVSVEIGVILALFFIPWMFLGTMIGWMVAAYGGEVVYCLAHFVMSAANFLVAFFRPTSFQLLCTYASVCSVGSAMSEVSSYYLVARKFPQDKMRSRVYIAVDVAGTVVTGLTYVFGSSAYQTFGHAAVFGCLAIVDLIVGASYGLLCCIAQDCARRAPLQTLDLDETRIINDNLVNGYSTCEAQNDENPAPVTDMSYWAILKTPLAFACYSQCLVIYAAFRSISATGPAWLQASLGISFTDNGSVLGMSSFFDGAVLSVVGVACTSNRRRWLIILAFVLVKATGFATYSFVCNVYGAMATEAAIRSAKAVFMALGPTLAFYITDKKLGLGAQARAGALYSTCKCTGRVLGAALAGWLVTVLGFRALTLVIAAILVPFALMSPVYSRL